MAKAVPTKILELRGSGKAHPERMRERKNEPISTIPIPDNPPGYFSPAQRRAWHEIKGLVPPGVLTGSDVLTIEIAACLLAQFRADPDKMQPAKLTRLSSELSSLGLNPSARAKMTVEKPKDDNPYE